MTNLNAIGLTELNQNEMNEIDGGLIGLLLLALLLCSCSPGCDNDITGNKNPGERKRD